jgi:hypothetical protein
MPARPGSAKKNEDTMSEERDIVERRPARLGGFAPGGYFCKCVHCGEQFTGDKRAISCLPCAIGFSEAELQRLRGEVERLREGLAPYLREVAALAEAMVSSGDYVTSGALLKSMTADAQAALNIQGE